MPEGDTIRNMVATFRPRMAGRRIVRAASRWPSVSFGLANRTVRDLEPFGKNLWITLDDDSAIRVHLGMRGRWRWVSEPYEGSLGNVSLLLAFDGGTAVCTGAPTVQRMPRKAFRIHPVLSTLGPDLLAADFDVEAVLARIPMSSAPTVAEILLDQRVACGIGNVYKSEVLFERGLYPFLPPQRLPPEEWRALYQTARTQMQSNVIGSGNRRPGPRVTNRRPSGGRFVVYGRSGRPCLVCATPIAAKISGGGLPRWTWWCPMCQRADGMGGEEQS